MRPIYAAAALLAATTASPAFAQDSIPSRGIFKTGEEIYQLCVSTKPLDLERCDYYLMAAYDMAAYFHDTDQVTASFCLPTGSGAQKLRDAAVSYWRANPNSRKYSAVSNVINALDKIYPGACK